MFRTTVVAVLVLAASFSAPAAEKWFENNLALNSTYIWRGMVLTDGPVFQPGITAGLKLAEGHDVFLDLWGSEDLDEANDTAGEFCEFDFTLDYTYEAEMITASLGALHYTYPNYESIDPTTEIYVKLGLKAPLKVELAAYRDVGTVEGLYASLGGSFEAKVGEAHTLEFGLSVGYGDKTNNRANTIGVYLQPPYDDDPKYSASGAARTEAERVADDLLETSGGLTDVAVKISLAKKIEDMYTVAITVTVAQLLGDFAEAVDYTNGDVMSVSGGLSWKAEF
jgi:uncharacterized protein (TIGR02001 family)